MVITNIAHHVTQRGNYQQPVFEHEEDYKKYCDWFKEYAKRYCITTYAYCLMNNHVHFIVSPKTEEGLARLFNTLHMRYAQYINKRRKATGHLWQGRFFSCLLDEQHLYRAIRYVERNPVRAKIAQYAWTYKWSSAKEHTGYDISSIPLNRKFEMEANEWKDYLKETDDEMITEIRMKTQRGLAMGTEQFIQKIESKLNRSLVCLGPGRPKKKT
ncbi:MAG: transposase [Actinobacteria bacterium]|nr:transposase [Actinomycetota bacterium]